MHIYNALHTHIHIHTHTYTHKKHTHIHTYIRADLSILWAPGKKNTWAP